MEIATHCDRCGKSLGGVILSDMYFRGDMVLCYRCYGETHDENE